MYFENVEKVFKILKLNNVSIIEPQLPSFRNLSFYIKNSNQSFCLRQHSKSKLKKDIEFENQILLYLSDHVIVPKPLYSLELDGVFYTLYNWIFGIRLDHYPSNIHKYESIGEKLAILHNKLQKFTIADKNVLSDLEYLPTTILELRYLISNTLIYDNVKILLERYLSLVEEYQEANEKSIKYLNPSKKQYIHGDYTTRNLIVTNNDLAILDFEDVHINDIFFDVAKALLYMCEFTIGLDKSIYFLKGYKSVISLNNAQINRIIFYIRYIIPVDIGWIKSAILQNNIDRLLLVRNDIERLKVLIYYRDMKMFENLIIPKILRNISN